MYNCTKCGELLGDSVRECPFCKNVITEKEISSMIAAEREETAHAEKIAMQQYRKNVLHEGIITVSYIVITFISIIVLCMAGVSESVLIMVIAMLFALFLAVSIKLKIGKCPYCERYLGRKSIVPRTYCPRCGGRLR